MHNKSDKPVLLKRIYSKYYFSGALVWGISSQNLFAKVSEPILTIFENSKFCKEIKNVCMSEVASAAAKAGSRGISLLNRLDFK